MQWILAFFFGAGFALAGHNELMQFALGAVLGWLLGSLLSLQSKVRQLERDAQQRDLVEKAVRQANDAGKQPAAKPADKPAQWPSTAAAKEIHPHETKSETTAKPKPSSKVAPASSSTPTPPAASWTETPGTRTDWREFAVLQWLLKGNVPVKVGVLVSFFGIAFLLKHAVDEGWLSLPIQLRLAGVAAFGVGLLWLGWRLRHSDNDSHRTYALSIQGGGIGVLYLVTFAAFRLFHVLPGGVAFVLLAILAAGAGWLAITQGARQLAVLGSIGGFLAPILASTGSGSHVALFSYYLVLNLGIAGVALRTHWRMLNLLGFTFTFGIGLVWGAQYYDQPYFASVEPFLVAHFLLYTAIAVLSALKQPFQLRGYVDSALVFGLPLVVFPLQAGLVDGAEQPLAWTATAMAVFYFALARGLVIAWAESLRLLSQVYIALAVIFATLAIPLWLDAPWVSNTWALEAAAMIWIGTRQRRALTHWGGVGLLFIASAVYLSSFALLESTPLLLSERFIGGLLLCVAYSFCAWIYASGIYAADREMSQDIPMDWFTAVIAWFGWLVLGSLEIFAHADNDWTVTGGLAYAAILTVALERAANRFAPQARVLAMSLLPLMAFYLAVWAVLKQHPLNDHGGMAWLLAFAALGWVVHQLEQRRWLLVGGSWLAAIWLAIETDYQVDRADITGHDWDSAMIIIVLCSFVLAARKQFARLYPADYDRTLTLGPIQAMLLLYVIAWTLESAGDFAPWPYLPVANLALLLSVAVGVIAYPFARNLLERRHCLLGAAALGLLFITLEIARSTHHFAGVRFASEPMWHSGVFQAALSITWSIVGIAGMVIGARLARRITWLAGAGLMGVVVAKLFLVDLGNTDSVTRIVSFIGVGLLLLVVGYFAPAPTAVKHGNEQIE